MSPYIRFYACYPLKDAQGYILGTFCVLDHVPHQFQQQEFDLLCDLAKMVEHEINLTHTRSLSPWKQGAQKEVPFDDATINMMLLDAM